MRVQEERRQYVIWRRRGKNSVLLPRLGNTVDGGFSSSTTFLPALIPTCSTNAWPLRMSIPLKLHCPEQGAHCGFGRAWRLPVERGRFQVSLPIYISLFRMPPTVSVLGGNGDITRVAQLNLHTVSFLARGFSKRMLTRVYLMRFPSIQKASTWARHLDAILANTYLSA